MKTTLLCLLCCIFAAPGALALDTIGAYVDVGTGLERFGDTPIGIPFDIVVVQRDELTSGATEFSVTELALLAPGIFKLNIRRANDSTLDLGNNSIGEYVIAYGDCPYFDFELVRITYLDLGGLIQDNVILGVGGNIEIQTGCSGGARSPCYAACGNGGLFSLYPEPPALVTGSGLYVPNGSVILNPVYPVVVDDPTTRFSARPLPTVINLKSQGEKFKVRLTQTGRFGVEAIAPETVRFNEIAEPLPNSFYVDYSVDPPVAEVTFYRNEVSDTLEAGDEVEFTVTGDLLNGADFVTTGTIRVIEPGVSTTVVPKLSASASPNPFNPSTSILYALPTGAFTEVSIYDASGRHVKTLVSGFVEAGNHSVPWDGRDTGGRRVASGVYHYMVRSGDHTASNRMVLLK
jgi:hypothetical protein